MAAKFSYVCAPLLEPYMYASIPDRVRILAEEDPSRPAFIFYDINRKRHVISRKELLDQSTSLAKKLLKLGVKKGDTVGICMNNSMNMLLSLLAVSAAGAIWFAMSTHLKDGSDIIETMNELKARYLIIDVDVGNANWTILENIVSSRKSTAAIPELQTVICNYSIEKPFEETESEISMASLLKQTTPDVTLPEVYPEDITTYFCTSGSTGKPKSVTYPHSAILNWTKTTDIGLNIKNESIYFNERPFAWVVGHPRTYLTEGTTRVFIDTRVSLSGNNIGHLCDIIEDEKCDVVYLPGYLATDLLNNPQYAPKFKNVKTLFFSGERVPLVNLRIKDTFCKSVYVYYGNTECGGTSVFTSDNIDDFEDGIAGTPLQGMEMKVVDASGDIVPVEESGELCLRTNSRFAGYRNRPDMFHAALDSAGWFHTGDMAHLRQDGNFVIEGRSREVISTGTNKYFPWELEKSLKKCTGARFVLAVGVPDVRLGQVVCACVVPEEGVKLTADDIKEFCDETFLEESTGLGLSLKPRYHLVFDKVPLTATGKVDRRMCGIVAIERLGL